MIAVLEAGAGNRRVLRCPVRGHGVVRQFHYIQQPRSRIPKGLTKEIEFLVGCLRVLGTALFMRVGEVNLDVGRSGDRDRVIEFAGNDRAWEAGLGPVETVFRSPRGRTRAAWDAAADHLLAGSNGYRN